MKPKLCGIVNGPSRAVVTLDKNDAFIAFMYRFCGIVLKHESIMGFKNKVEHYENTLVSDLEVIYTSDRIILIIKGNNILPLLEKIKNLVDF